MTDFSQFQFKENIGTQNTPHTPGVDEREPWEDQINEVIEELMPHKRYKQIIIFSSIFGKQSVALYFFTTAIIVNVLSNQIIVIKVEYQDKCQNKTICRVDFDVSNDILGGTILYYEIDKFEQNSRETYQSLDKQQLMGKQRSLSELQKTCGKYTTNAQMNKQYSINGTPLKPEEQAIPCGYMAMSYFNDSFRILDSQNQTISIEFSNLANAVDKELYFRNSENYQTTAWQDVNDEHFIVWMNPSAISPFRKPWGRIFQNLQAGKYQLEIKNNYDTQFFPVRKSFVFVRHHILGYPKPSFIILHYILGGLNLGIIIFSIIKIKVFWRQKKEHLS